MSEVEPELVSQQLSTVALAPFFVWLRRCSVRIENHFGLCVRAAEAARWDWEEHGTMAGEQRGYMQEAA